MSIQKLLKKLSFIALLVAIGVSCFGTSSTHAAAVTGFQAGRIMDDAVFTKKSSMSASQIQNFLNSKMPNCDTNGKKTSEWGGGTRAQYGKAHGNPAPFVCLKNYKENPTVTGNSAKSWWKNGRTNLPGSTLKTSGAKTAAQIIYQAAQDYSINPQVLVVLLQKEQGLVTDDWPWIYQYRSATGYGCPDTAACATQYYGLYNQVRWSARMFRAILNQSDTWYTPYSLGNNQIYWNPNTSCGRSTVNIQNLTTVALYSYTPYRPNQAALNAGYGNGNSCSSYGNRNFYQYFKDWFGATKVSDYKAQAAGQSSNMTIKQGETAPVYVRFKNTGALNWYDDSSAASVNQNPVRIATDIPLNRASSLGSIWQWRHRPGIGFDRVYETDGSVSADQTVVKPGETAEFWFAYYAPHGSRTGQFKEGFRPIVEGWGPMNNTGTYFNVTVNPAVYKAQYVSQSANPTINKSQSSSVSISYKNTGNVTWHDETSAPGSGQLPIHLATDYPLNRSSNFSATWPYPHRPAINFTSVYESNGTTLASNQHKVQPGQIAKFTFALTVPSNKAHGFYQEPIRPIVQGLGPMNNTGTWIGVTVP